ncbi:hypothetical protein, partial [Marivita sp. XM-24bin2]|uniref:hypothetical protein n=1 Tax=Marivita sp. XM-24bin2 TaxID=2133951 RepID=UPI0025C1E2A5
LCWGAPQHRLMTRSSNKFPDMRVQYPKATYIAVEGRPGEPLIADKFNVGGLSLLSTQDADIEQQIAGRAIIKANRSKDGLTNLKGKLNEFTGDLRPPNKSGVRTPYNADLANSVGMFAEIELRDLWRHPTKPFPQSAEPIAWEVWLEPDEVNDFVATAVEEGMTVYPDRLVRQMQIRLRPQWR